MSPRFPTFRKLMPLATLALPLSCGPAVGDVDELWSATKALITTVTAKVETTPVAHAGDAADDPCVWLHPTDLAQSVVIGTDKQGAINVYTLSGQLLQSRADGNINNIDLRYGFPLGTAQVALVGGTNRSNRTLQFWKVNADRTLSTAGSIAVSSSIADVYGFALYRSATTGKYHAFVVDKDSGIIEQYELDGSTGVVRGTRVRQLDNGGISEGLVADDTHGHLYASEETVGVWRYGAEPGAGSTRTAVVSVGTNDVVADVEGLSIYQRSDGTGYLIASSQGNSTYAVFNRLPPHQYRGSFRIGAGTTIDGTSDTDGLDVTNVNLGATFPEGLFIAQDGTNTGGNQNFKLVSWGDIARSVSLGIDTSFDPRQLPGTAAETLIPAGATWKYLDNGSDQGTAWRGVSFNDSVWASGAAELGYGDGDEATLVGYGPSATSKYVTTYFRHAFQVTSPTSYTALSLRLKRDDGAVVYLNGSEVFRTNMPTGTITSATLASTNLDDETFHTAALSPSLLLTGTNVLAIEVHQSAGTSTDISLVAELTGTK